MKSKLQPAVPADQNGFENIAENDSLRESLPENTSESSHIIEMTFEGSDTPFRESSIKMPRKQRNSELRSREYLTPAEVERVMKGAESVGRHAHRDATIVLIAYRHGLRVSELCALRWDQVDLQQGLLHVRRKKNGNPATHPLHGPELRALRRLQRDYPDSPYIFTGERKGPLTESCARKIVARAGKAAGLPFSIHFHMMRHSCGFKLANDGVETRAIQAYLGHRNITHTVRYTELSPERFKDFWQD